jgi:hypothetical protein
MSLNGVTAIGTGGIMTNTVFGVDSFLYNTTGYENTILGWYQATSSYSFTEPVEFSGYGNVYVGSENFSLNNAIRNVFIGGQMFINADTTTIDCTDNIFIGIGIDSITGVNDNNVFIGRGAGASAESTNSIVIGNDSLITSGISNNNIVLGSDSLINFTVNNTIAAGYSLLTNFSTDTPSISYNDILIGNYAFINYFGPEISWATQDNIIIQTNGTNNFTNNTPRFAEKSVNLCFTGDNMFGVQVGFQIEGNDLRRSLDYVDYTSTFIGGSYVELDDTVTPVLNRKLTSVGFNAIIDFFKGTDCTFIGDSGGALNALGSNNNNTFIGWQVFATKNRFNLNAGYVVSNSTLISERLGRLNSPSGTVTNLTILGGGYRQGITTLSNNTFVGTITLLSGGISSKSNCTSIGYNALRAITSGAGNSTAIGSGALATETSGVNNTAIGASSVSGATSQNHTLVGQGITNSVTGNIGVTIIGQGITNSSAGTGSLILGKSAANTVAARAVFGSSTVNAGAIAVESLVSNTTWTVIINGTQYKMLLRA